MREGKLVRPSKFSSLRQNNTAGNERICFITGAE